MTALHTVRGANYWSRRPVTRMELRVGAYDEISSADVPGVGERLAAAMPGLVEHHCSPGVRGGFLQRLARGTYAPHIVEHVALELQQRIGHHVGFGRTRGGDAPGEYTLVFEHEHELVGLRAASLALDAVQRAFAGSLADVRAADDELGALARTPDAPPLVGVVGGVVCGGAGRGAVRDALTRVLPPACGPVVNLSPAHLLLAGLPFRRCGVAVVLDAAVPDVPARYRERDRAERLLAVLADGVPEGGLFVAPAGALDLQARARRAGCRVALLGGHGVPPRDELDAAAAAAWIDGGRLVLARDGAAPCDAGEAVADAEPPAQLAALLVRALAARDLPGAAVPGVAPAS